ncbi:hypothetical protein QTP88_020314 [Uroleucon formosanum]
MYRSEFIVAPRSRKSISNTPCLSQNTVAIIFLADKEQNNESRNNENGEHVHTRTGEKLKERQQKLRERYLPEQEKQLQNENVCRKNQNAISTMREKCNVNHQLSNESNNEDKYFSKEINTFLCDSDTSKCVPFLALWTPIVNNKINNGIGIRQSNATIESWFKTIKVDILDGDYRWKCNRAQKPAENAEAAVVVAVALAESLNAKAEAATAGAVSLAEEAPTAATVANAT